MPQISTGNKEVREHLRSCHKGWTATRGNPLLPFAKEQRGLHALKVFFFIAPESSRWQNKKAHKWGQKKRNRPIRSQIWPKVYRPPFVLRTAVYMTLYT